MSDRLDYLIGRHFVWTEYGQVEGDICSDNYSGYLTDIQGDYIILTLDDTSVIQRHKYFFVDFVNDALARDIIYKDRAAAIREAQGVDTRPYSIYALVDPRDKRIRYIGISHQVETRYKDHLRRNDKNFLKNAWLEELYAQNIAPELLIIEETTGRRNALQREDYWIRYHIMQRAALTNLDAQGLATLLLPREVEEEVGK